VTKEEELEMIEDIEKYYGIKIEELKDIK